MRESHIRRFRSLHVAAVVRKQDRIRNMAAVLCLDGSPGVNLQGPNRNKREDQFANEAVSRGWTVIKRGWPDFLCWKGDEMVFVEVKPEGDPLSAYQNVVMDKLAGLGLRWYRWSPRTGFTQIKGQQSGASSLRPARTPKPSGLICPCCSGPTRLTRERNGRPAWRCKHPQCKGGIRGVKYSDGSIDIRLPDDLDPDDVGLYLENIGYGVSDAMRESCITVRTASERLLHRDGWSGLVRRL